MDPNVLIQNDILFSNLIIEMIPHPTGLFGNILNLLTIFCHYLAGIPVFIVLLPLLYFFYDSKFGIKMGAAILLTGVSNGLMKFFAESPRPVNLSEKFFDLQNWVKESSFGFPSGHSHISVLLWGMIFLRFKDWKIKGFALFLLLFTPFSRIYSGIHYPGDVLGGIVSGLILLVLLEKFFKKYPNFPDIDKWENPKSKIKSIALLLISAALGITLLENSNLSNQHKHSLDQVLSAIGSIIGFFLGISYWKFYHPKENFKSYPIFPLIIFLGINIVVFYLGVSYIGKLFTIESSMFRIVKYALINFSILYITPFLTLKYIGEKIKVG